MEEDRKSDKKNAAVAEPVSEATGATPAATAAPAPPAETQTLDLSTDGFRATPHLQLEKGTDVWLRLPGLEPYQAKVMWSKGNFIGCAFDRPLHPAVLSMIVSRSGGFPTLS